MLTGYFMHGVHTIFYDTHGMHAVLRVKTISPVFDTVLIIVIVDVYRVLPSQFWFVFVYVC